MGHINDFTMNTPPLTTDRLVLRRFTEDDAQALFSLLSDEEVNRFLPMFPLKSLEEAAVFLRKRYLEFYEKPTGYRYAVCLREDHAPIGYIHADDGEGRDFGYGLRKQFWGMGITTEAGRAVVGRLQKDGVPFVTATHDKNNPASGAVMKKLGMTYRYSYEEQWQPKNIPVTFRMYQLNLDGHAERVYRGYWDRYPVHFIEQGV